MRKKFYRIVIPSESELIGVKDGMFQSEVKSKFFKDVDNYNNFYKYFMTYDDNYFVRYTRFPPFEINLEYIELRRDAILTDFLTFAPSIPQNFLISEKTQKLLIKFNLPEYKFYKAVIYDKSFPNYDYSLFYYPLFGSESVNFKESIFSKGNERIGKKRLSISNANEFQALKGPYNVDKLVLSKDFNFNLDFFRISLFIDPIISEPLRDELLNSGVTGIKIVELNNSEFEIIE